MSDHAFAFASQNTFLKVAGGDSSRPYAMVGVPWDGAVTNRPGARFGPDAIRRASHMLCDGIHPHFNVTPVGHLTDLGDLALPNTGIEKMRAAMMPLLPPILAAHHVCWLGGDHSITLPLLRAYRAHCGRPLALIHLDAHCDTWADHFGEPSGHGTWTFEALEAGLIIPEATIQIGIRSSGTKAAREYVNAVGGRVITARELRGRESPAQLAELLDDIRSRVAAAG